MRASLPTRVRGPCTAQHRLHLRWKPPAPYWSSLREALRAVRRHVVAARCAAHCLCDSFRQRRGRITRKLDLLASATPALVRACTHSAIYIIYIFTYLSFSSTGPQDAGWASTFLPPLCTSRSLVICLFAVPDCVVNIFSAAQRASLFVRELIRNRFFVAAK